MRAPPFSLAFVVALLLAGCVAPATPTAPGDAAGLLAKLRAMPVPQVDGAAHLAWLQSFVDAHHPRLSGTPDEKAAADDLAAQLAKFGYKVERHKYSQSGAPDLDGPFQAVVGIKTGTTDPDRVIVVGGHYDTAPAGTGDVPAGTLPANPPAGTPPLYATYDNGAGTSFVLELARLLATVPTNKTIHFAFFNGEEEGLIGGKAYAEEMKAKSAKVDAYAGFDMVGINYPSKDHCLCVYAGKQSGYAATLNPLQETVAFDLLGFPRGNATVQVFDNHDTRSSDEAAWATAGFPTMRWAGMARAGDYWAYHKMNDTMDTMVKQAGGRDVLAAGFENAAKDAYYTILAVDATTLVYGAK